MKTLWMLLNYLIVMVVIGLTTYFLFAGPPAQMKTEQEDATIANVQQNSGYARLVAWVKSKLGKADQPPLFPSVQQDQLSVPALQGGFQPPAQNINQGVMSVQGAPPFRPPEVAQDMARSPGSALPPVTGVFAPSPVPSGGGFGQMEKVLQAGHWIGLEANNLTPALAFKNGIPQAIKGVLVDKVTLLAAQSGFLPGDVIVAINDVPTVDLHAFRVATRPVAMSKQAAVTVYRGGSYRRIEVRWTEELGIAQVEAAQMINATDPSPHGYYGPCDMCHAISKNPKGAAQIAVNTQAPPIKWGAKIIHENRGLCTNCHKII